MDRDPGPFSGPINQIKKSGLFIRVSVSLLSDVFRVRPRVIDKKDKKDRKIRGKPFPRASPPGRPQKNGASEFFLKILSPDFYIFFIFFIYEPISH
jgi:hypothetical protein